MVDLAAPLNMLLDQFMQHSSAVQRALETGPPREPATEALDFGPRSSSEARRLRSLAGLRT